MQFMRALARELLRRQTRATPITDELEREFLRRLRSGNPMSKAEFNEACRAAEERLEEQWRLARRRIALAFLVSFAGAAVRGAVKASVEPETRHTP